MRATFFLLLGLFALSQCKSKREELEFYEDSPTVIKSRYETVDGIKQGNEFIYSKSGNVIEKHFNEDGKRSGLSSFYKNDGRLYLQITYRKGIKNGSYYIYYPNLNIAEKGDFLNNYKHGEIQQYFELDSGKVQFMLYQFYMDGKEHLYYKKEFDALGKWIAHFRDSFIRIPNDTLISNRQIVIPFELNHSMDSYDSAFVFWEHFSLKDNQSFKKDSMKLHKGKGEIPFVTANGQMVLRGRWRAHRTWADSDSTYSEVRTGYFEEPYFGKDQ